MAKHDQRILKFLTQNADRAPTITDMMTRLNISISDITDSLNSLVAQGMVSKRTNGQGIECWFPTAGPAPQMASEPTQPTNILSEYSRLTSSTPPLNPPSPASAPAGSGDFANLARPKMPGIDTSVFSVATTRSTPNPEPAPEILSPSMNAALEPAQRGVGWLPFLIGLLATGVIAVLVSGLSVRQDIALSSKGMVEKSEMEAAAASWADFEASTQSKMLELETQVKDLSSQLAAMKTQNDSLRALVSRQAEEAMKSGTASRRVPVRKRR